MKRGSNQTISTTKDQRHLTSTFTFIVTSQAAYLSRVKGVCGAEANEWLPAAGKYTEMNGNITKKKVKFGGKAMRNDFGQQSSHCFPLFLFA